MRGILLYILIFLCLSVAGCSGGRSYDSRLAAADSLVASQPDSALRLLRSVGFDSMGSNADRAYFALLLTQAKYKCDEIITSTDTIDIAVDYFSGGEDADKRLRSLIYRGASFSDMGEITAAMEAYKQAEAAASPDDYENLGYINLRMANLYQRVYSDGREYIDKYRKALHYYELCGNKHYQIVCTSRLGAVYRLNKMDSAYYFINKSIELAKSEKDSVWFFINLESLAGYYMIEKQYDKQKDIALYVFNNGRKFVEDEHIYILSRAYLNLEMLDSAEYYLEFADGNGQLDENFVSRLMTMKLVALARNDYKSAYKYSEMDMKISDSITSVIKNSLAAVESSVEIERQRVAYEQSKNNMIIILAVLIVAVLLLLLALLLLKLRNKSESLRLMTLIQELKNDYSKATSTIEENKALIESITAEVENNRSIISNYEKCFDRSDFVDSSIGDAFDIQLEQINTVIKILDNINNIPTNKLQQQLKEALFTHTGTKQITQFINLVNYKHNNAINRIKEEYPSLDEKDIQLITLMYLGFPNSYICFFLGYTNRQSVINRRRNIVEKLGINE
ncbi:MAG: hypothetical protein PUB55_02560, partial [Bacteroidales bacterium]|nr:hypothetical protein [Bacteroidales bacterium]